MRDGDGDEDRIRTIEGRVKRLEEELWKLRDKYEEEVWARRRLEEKLKGFEEETSEEVKEVKKELKTEMKEVVRGEVREAGKDEMKTVDPFTASSGVDCN